MISRSDCGGTSCECWTLELLVGGNDFFDEFAILGGSRRFLCDPRLASQALAVLGNDCRF